MAESRIEDEHLKQVIYIIGILGIIALGFYTVGLLKKPFYIIFDLLSPFILGLILAYIISPLVSLIQNKLRLGRVAGTLLVFFLILAVFFTFMAVIIPVILSQVIELVETIRSALPILMSRIAESPYLSIDPNLIKTLEGKLQEMQIDYEKIVNSILPAVKEATTGGISTVSRISAGIFRGVRSVIGFGAFLVLVAIVNFYLILDWDRTGPFLPGIAKEHLT